MEFYRNKKKSVKLILACAGILVVLVLLFLYSIGAFGDIFSAKLAAASGLFGLILAIVITKMFISLTDKSALIILNNEGIIAKVTAVSKAAGLMRWEDIADMTLNKVGGDTLITLTIDKPEKYIPIIRKKLSKLLTDGAEDVNGNLEVHLTASALDLEAPELFTVIKNYRKGIIKI